MEIYRNMTIFLIGVFGLCLVRTWAEGYAKYYGEYGEGGSNYCANKAKIYKGIKKLASFMVGALFVYQTVMFVLALCRPS